MDMDPILDRVCADGDAAALAGCRLAGVNSESCAHDLVVFNDAGGEQELMRRGGGAVMVHRVRLDETRPSMLLGCLDVSILRDDRWRLAPFLESVRRRKDGLASACVRDGATAAVLYAQRALQADAVDDASCWQKCAALCLADAALIAGGRRPSSHALDGLRRMQDDAGVAALVAASLDVERATPSLLARMTEAAAGLSAMAGPEAADIVRFRSASMQQDGRLADCYYYLCRVGRDAVSILGGPACDQTAMYASRICLDAVREAAPVRRNATAVREAAGRMLDGLAGR